MTCTKLLTCRRALHRWERAYPKQVIWRVTAVTMARLRRVTVENPRDASITLWVSCPTTTTVPDVVPSSYIVPDPL
jgi:hypothetical protein